MLWAMGYEYDEWAKLGGLTWSRSAKSLKRVSAERRRKETEMEEYPEELRTPPVSLVSLVGFAQHHHLISTHLLSHQPPINTLALPDLSKLLLLLPKSNKPPLPVDSQPQGQAGILKRDWLVKHRTRIPSVVAPLFSSDQLSGDPTKWLQVCSDLDNLKAVIRPRNIKFLLIIILKDGDDINEDRFLALRRRAELDAKYILTFNPDDASQLQHSLNRLGSTFAELANIYYRDEGKRIKTRVEKKGINSIDFNIRSCFKTAVYAEFRRDWAEAVRLYEDAYHALREMIGTSTRLPPIQRLVEIKTVAEQLHFKISNLLLHGGKVKEAVTWFRQHNTSYRKVVGAPEVIFLHWEWMSRQFLVFGELLETSSASIQNISSLVSGTTERPLTEWELHPSYYYQLAANYLKEKRSSLELALSMSETSTEIDASAESVVPSVYVGQFAQLLELGDSVTMKPLTDEEYTRYAIAEGERFQDSFEIIALLKKSCESYGNLKARRMGSFCAFQMATEYFTVGDFSNAKQLFDGVASHYRQEGWVTLLWEVLGFLRECSKKQGVVRDFVEYSLEMAALPVSSGTDARPFRFKEYSPAGPPSFSQREVIHKEVFGLVCGEAGSASVEDNNAIKIGVTPLHIEIDHVSPLRVVLLASVAFHEQIVKPGVSTLITVSLLSQLPHTVEINQLEVQFNQSECNFVILNAQKPSFAAMTDEERGHQVESAPLRLVTNKWLRLTYGIKSKKSGKLECVSVIAKMGPHFTICCRAESSASMDDLPLWKYEDRVETYPTKDPAIAFSGQKAIQVEEPEPLVDLYLGASGPAFIGESFMAPVTVSSRGHDIYSGELKINLVDVRGGVLFSPRETESSSMDSHHVELIGIVGEDESQLGSEKFEKIQQSFGLVSVPFLKNGDSWSCKLEIKWHRPKPVMLFVSLGYSPLSDDLNAQKVNIHKSLPIEGVSAIAISHHFMLPFRRDPLLLSRIKPVHGSEQLASLPLNETSLLIVSAKNCTQVPLQLKSMSIENEVSESESSCSVLDGGNDLLRPALLVPGEEFKKVFTVVPKSVSSMCRLGTVCLRWRRDSESGDPSSFNIKEASVLSRHKLPDVKVELSPLVVSLECTPYAILGDPFTYMVKIQNQTQLLQEVKLSLADSQSFVLAGSHNDTVFILPKSEHILSYKIVPLASGSQPLPKVTVSSGRYSAGFQPSNTASTVFVFPLKPDFKMDDVGERRIESITSE